MRDEHTITSPLTSADLQRATSACASVIRHPRSLQRPFPEWRAPMVTIPLGKTHLILKVARRRITGELWGRLSDGLSAPPPSQGLFLLSLAVGHPSAFTSAPIPSAGSAGVLTPVAPTDPMDPTGTTDIVQALLDHLSSPAEHPHPTHIIQVNREPLREPRPGILVRHLLVTSHALATVGASRQLSSSGTG